MGFLESVNQALAPISGYLAIGAALIAVAAAVIAIVMMTRYGRLKHRLDRFTEGRDAASLEDILLRVLEDNQKVKTQLKNNINEIVRINENLLTAYRKIGIVKYNAFPGMAGKVSSSICLLNNENNGIVISSVHGQEGCYTYIREIMNGKSVGALTKEDEEALKSALQMEL